MTLKQDTLFETLGKQAVFQCSAPADTPVSKALAAAKKNRRPNLRVCVCVCVCVRAVCAWVCVWCVCVRAVCAWVCVVRARVRACVRACEWIVVQVCLCVLCVCVHGCGAFVRVRVCVCGVRLQSSTEIRLFSYSAAHHHQMTPNRICTKAE